MFFRALDDLISIARPEMNPESTSERTRFKKMAIFSQITILATAGHKGRTSFASAFLFQIRRRRISILPPERRV